MTETIMSAAVNLLSILPFNGCQCAALEALPNASNDKMAALIIVVLGE